MKFYVKTAEGILREATQGEVLSTDTVLWNAEGDALDRKPTEQDPIRELTGLVTELTGTVANLKENQEKNKEALAAYDAAAKRGFPIPMYPTAQEEEDISKYAPYDMARQGKRLMDKIHHPGYRIETDEKRLELAKYYVLFLKAGVMQDPIARMHMTAKYGEPDQEIKTAIGDTGNVFPVPDIVETEILAFAREQSKVLQFARIWEMTSEKMSFPQESAGASVAWGNTTSTGDPTIGEVELSAEELSSYSTVKNATLADARTDIVSWLTETMAEAAGLELDNSAFNGDGTTTYGGCSGILSAACGYSVTMGAGSTAFSQIAAGVLSEMIGKLDGLKKMGGRFWIHGSVLHFIRSLEDTAGRPIFIETVGAPMSGTIWGYPYTEVTNLPSTSAVSTAFVAFGNLRYFACGRRLGATALMVDPYGLFTTNRTRFKIYQRWAQKMGLPKGFTRLLTAGS